MSESNGDEINKEIEDAAKYKKSLENATEAKKRKQIWGIMEVTDKMDEDPSQVEIIKVPWYKKLGRSLGRFFYNFFTKIN